MEPIVTEMREEATITRRVLETVPGHKLSWKPHRKSISLGQSARHIASVPGNLSNALPLEEFTPNLAIFNSLLSRNIEEFLATFEQGARAAEELLSEMNRETALAKWRVTAPNRKEVLYVPRLAAIGSIMMNHCYHHRVQVSEYLRLLEIPVQVTYGRSAEEDPVT